MTGVTLLSFLTLPLLSASLPSPPLPQPFCDTQGFLFCVLSGSSQVSGMGLGSLFALLPGNQSLEACTPVGTNTAQTHRFT